MPATIRGIDFRNRITLTRASTTSSVVPVEPPMSASSLGPKPSDIGGKTSGRTPESGSGFSKATVVTSVVEIAAKPAKRTVIVCPARGPTTRNIEPSARKGLLSTPPKRKNVR